MPHAFAARLAALAALTATLGAQTQPGQVVGHAEHVELVPTSVYTPFPTGPLGDFDGDGTPDLIAGGGLVLLNPDGSVKARIPVPGPIPHAALGDVDGDGVTDLACAEIWPPSVWVTFLNADGSVRDSVQVAGLSVESGEQVTALEGLGDLDGDGVPDLAVGDAFDEFGAECGIAWVVFLNADGTLRGEVPIAASEGDFVCFDPLNETHFGQSLAALGDLDGDGLTELAVGGPADDDGDLGDFNTDNGAVWIFFLDADGGFHASTKLSAAGGGVLPNLGSDHMFGASVSGLGDLDGDGTPDLAVGAWGPGWPTGGLHVLRLAPDGTSLGYVTVSPGQGGFGGAPAGTGFAWNQCAPGDVDGDGVVDLVTRTLVGGSAFPPVPDTHTTWTLFLNASTWTGLGQGLGGTLGIPVLAGEGALVAGSDLELALSRARPGSSAWLVTGLSTLEAPFKGGVLVPTPDVVFGGLPIDGSGRLDLTGVWPAGLPGGLQLLLQAWIVDPVGPAGLAASNGLSLLSAP